MKSFIFLFLMGNLILPNNKLLQSLKYFFLFVLINLLACASVKNISYTPEEKIVPWFKEKGPKIYISEFDNKSEDTIGVLGSYSFCGDNYLNDLNCPQYFKNMFSKELQKLGFQLVKDINQAKVIMMGTIQLFHEDNVLLRTGWTAIAKLKLEFLDKSRNLLLLTHLNATSIEPNTFNISGRKVRQIKKIVFNLLGDFHLILNNSSIFSNFLNEDIEQRNGAAESPPS